MSRKQIFQGTLLGVGILIGLMSSSLFNEPIVYAQGTDEPPSGMVVAFDLASCPAGWSELTAARGRMVVGTNPAQFSNPDGEGVISERSLGQTGGEETHTLTIDEMPSHAHQTLGDSNSQTTTGLGWWNSSSESAPLTQTGSTGGGQAHNNMPPFIALLYCQKD